MTAMEFDIKNRHTGNIQFTVEIDCGENKPHAIKLGLAVQQAVKEGADLGGAYLVNAYLGGADLGGAHLVNAYLVGADLGGADLAGAHLVNAYLAGADLGGADLVGADLGGADLAGADLVDGGQRSDGYRFTGQRRDGVLWILAGCRYFPIHEAREHWHKTRGGTPLGDETFAILDHIEAVARIRGLVGHKEAAE